MGWKTSRNSRRSTALRRPASISWRALADFRMATWNTWKRAPPLLGVIHGEVGVAKHILGLPVVALAQRRADARAWNYIPALECKRRGERALDAPRRVLCVGRADDLLEQHRELVAPEPRHHVPRPHRCPQAFRDLRQDAVARRVAEAVVHRLEVVAVEEQHTEPVIGITSRARERLGHPLDEVGTVGQVGQRIVQRRVQQLLLDLLPLGDIVRDRRSSDDRP